MNGPENFRIIKLPIPNESTSIAYILTAAMPAKILKNKTKGLVDPTYRGGWSG